MIAYRLPLCVKSKTNSRWHWAARARVNKIERKTAWLLTPRDVPVPCTVRLTRIGPRRMDSDNLAECMKSVRDGIAQRLGVDDGDPRITWQYSQKREGEGVYAVEVEIVAVEAEVAA